MHFGTWETVAADAGMRKDAYYRWRGSLEEKGVLSVTERPGTTTVHEVNADWFAKATIPENENDPSGKGGNALPGNENDPSGDAAMKGNHEGDPGRGLLRSTYPEVKRLGATIYLRLVRAEEMSTTERHSIIGILPVSERLEWNDKITDEAHLV